MATGTVVRFDRRRGYGFVSPDDGGEDVFVHQNNINMEGFRFLQVGEHVSYELEVGEKGMKAVSVSLTEPRAPRPARDDEQDQGYQQQPRDDRGGERGSDRGEDRGQQDDGGYDRPRRPAAMPAARARAPKPARGGDDNGAYEKLRRRHERLISLLVEKGILAPGDIDGIDGKVEAAVASAQGE